MRFRIHNDSPLPEEELRELALFVGDRFRIVGTVSIRVTDIRASGDSSYSGRTEDNRRGYGPLWAWRAMFAVSLGIPADPNNWLYGTCHVHGQARMSTRRLRNAWRRGDVSVDGWPIIFVKDWRDAFVVMLAHELCHVMEWERGEVYGEKGCERTAAAVLAEYRLLRD